MILSYWNEQNLLFMWVSILYVIHFISLFSYPHLMKWFPLSRLWLMKESYQYVLLLITNKISILNLTLFFIWLWILRYSRKQIYFHLFYLVSRFFLLFLLVCKYIYIFNFLITKFLLYNQWNQRRINLN